MTAVNNSANNPPTNAGPQLGAEAIELLEKLTNACAVSGDERAVRAIVLERVRATQPQATVRVDALGNVLVSGLGAGDAPHLRVMVAAHMDEVGFMLTNDEGDGIFRFDTVGGLDARQLAGKPVWVGRERTPGVIGAKPIHLTGQEERRQAISLETLRIDVGPANGRKVGVGDRATFATAFARLGPSLRAKALDDRLGVASLLALVASPPPGVELLAAFTVQEEVGLRGARVAAYALEPDLAIVLDCTPANDLPTWDDSENTRYNTRLGHGPAIYLADSATLSDPRLAQHFARVGEAAGIPFQFRQPGGGGTDAGAIHKQRAGIPSLSISVPGRYIHSAAAIARLEDWQNTVALLWRGLAHLSPAVLASDS